MSEELEFGFDSDIQEEFLQGIDEISYLTPELGLYIFDKMRKDDDFYYSTGRTANKILSTAIIRRRRAKLSTNIFIHAGSLMAVGKSWMAISLAKLFDETFNLDNLVFDLTQLENLIPDMKEGTIYVADDVRGRLGVGAKGERINITAFIETCAQTGTSIFFCSPRVQQEAGINYYIEVFGFCGDYSLAMVFDRNNRPIGWLKCIIPNSLRPMLEEYKKKKEEYMTTIRRTGGAPGGYTDPKVARAIADIEEMGLTFESEEKLKKWIYRTYEGKTYRTQDAIYDGVRDVLFPGDVPTIPITYENDTDFRDFLLRNITDTTLIGIIKLYSKDNIDKMDEVAAKLDLDSAARVSEVLKPFVEKRLGDLYEIYYHKGGEPAPQGEVDAWEEGLPTNLKATYQRRKKLRIPIDKMRPEISAALDKKCKVRIRAINLYYKKEVVSDIDPQEVMAKGSAVITFSK